MSLLAELAEEPETGLTAMDYSQIPYIARRWLWDGTIPVGSPVLFAAAGETGKGMLLCAVVARVVLGLPFPGEDQELRRPPQRALWISGVGEDDLFEDLAPRFRAAIAVAVAEFGLDPELATERGAIRLVHDLSEWSDSTPVSLPADCARVLAEVKAIPETLGGPPVALVVADSLSALLSDGYTIESRQGARRTMAKLSRFARRADVAFAVIHHMTKDGKVAGSPAVLDSLRLAFVIARSKDDEAVRMITRHKSNISAVDPQGYVIAGDGPGVHAAFIDGQDQRAARVSQATSRAVASPAAPVPGSTRARMAAAAAPAEAGPFRVLRMFQPVGGRQTSGSLPGPLATRDAARASAATDAGCVLAWKAGDRPGMEVAVFKRADGARLGYAVCGP
jgi:hypothetical protein